MKLENPLKANDWPLLTLFKLIAALQVLVFVVLGMDALGLSLPVVRPLLMLVYLLFVPGILLLRVLKLHDLNVIEVVTYTVGLSVASVMLVGLFMNTVYVAVIARPLSLFPLVVTMSALVLALSLLSYRRDRTFARSTTIDLKLPASPFVPALLLLPFISVFGAYLFNTRGTSTGIIVALIAVSTLVLACGATNRLPQRYYALAVCSVALTLLFHNALITNYVWGFDIQIERFVGQVVATNGVWGAAPNLDRNVLNLNAMLSITMLAPLLSLATGVSLTWVFKLIYPLLFALVPLALYRLYEKQTTPRLALFGVFYFMVTFSFYTEMVAMARQEIAEFFFVALLLLIVDRHMARGPRVLMFSLFGFSLIVSHYALTYIFLFCFILAWLVLALTKRFDLRALANRIRRTDEHERPAFALWKPRGSRSTYKGIRGAFVVGLTALALLWYRFANNSQPFNSLISITKVVGAYIGVRLPFAQPWNPLTALTPSNSSLSTSDTPAAPVLPSRAGGMDATGFQTIIAYKLPMHQVTEYLVLIAVILSIAGILVALASKRYRFTLQDEFVAFSIAGVAILYLCLVQPFFAQSLNISRFYHITQIVLGIFFVIGSVGIVRAATSVLPAARRIDSLPMKLVACFMVLLFLFNSGLVYKAAGELNSSPTVFALDKNVDYSKYNDQELAAARWIGGNSSGNPIVADYFRFYAVYAFDESHAKKFPPSAYVAPLPAGSYAFLGTPNVQSGELVLDLNILTMLTKTIGAQYYVGGCNNIYSNGDAAIYLSNG